MGTAPRVCRVDLEWRVDDDDAHAFLETLRAGRRVEALRHLPEDLVWIAGGIRETPSGRSGGSTRVWARYELKDLWAES